MKLIKSQQGISMVEVIIAMGVLSMISMGIMRSMNTASKANKNMK